MTLDRDVTTGFGPETITIGGVNGLVKPDTSYYFSVHHYSGQKTLYESEAKLSISGIPGLYEMKVSTDPVTYASSSGYWRCFSFKTTSTGAVDPGSVDSSRSQVVDAGPDANASHGGWEKELQK